MNLSFEFMEKTKNTPEPRYTTQKIYFIKTVILLIWILLGNISTSFIFFDKFIVFFGIGFLFQFARITEKKSLFQNIYKIYFLLLTYALLPFSTPFLVLIVTSLFLVIIMDVFFESPSGFLIHPSILFFLFISMIFNYQFNSYEVPIISINYDLYSFLYSYSIDNQISVVKILLSLFFTTDNILPVSNFGIVLFLVYLVPFVPSIIYRGMFLFLFSYGVFSFFSIFITNIFLLPSNFLSLTIDIWLKYMYSSSIVLHLFIIGLFLISETIGLPFFNYKKHSLLIVLQAIFLWLFFVAGFGFMSIILMYSVVYIILALSQYMKINKKQIRVIYE